MFELISNLFNVFVEAAQGAFDAFVKAIQG